MSTKHRLSLSSRQTHLRLFNSQSGAGDTSGDSYGDEKMPPLFDEVQIHNALQNEALPALERLAGNSRFRDATLRRFDRDEPPPYQSSTDDDDSEYVLLHPALGINGDTVLDDFKDLMDPPLQDNEQSEVATSLFHTARVYDPGVRYRAEVRTEERRIDGFSWLPSDDTKKYLHFSGRAGQERRNVIARRNIKRRWQKLGVWNPQWGIPDRRNNPQPNDEPCGWKWRWEHDSSSTKSTTSYEAPALGAQHPIRRGVRLRQGLRRDEHVPVPPRSHIPDDASASLAESFIISRPWFIYESELSEEYMRFRRIPLEKRRHYKDPMAKHVIEQWKLRGDWRDDWRDPGGEFVPGWKWRHESPSPEPEDLTPLNTSSMEFTPSEVDALEAIPPPTPPPERHYYPPGDPRREPGTGLFARPPDPPLEPSDPAGTQETGEPEPQSPLRRRQRQRRRRDENPSQPPRRSARIAANLANLSPPQRPTPRPGPAHPPARSRRGRPRKASEPAVPEPPARLRGRPRKDGRSAVPENTARPRGRPRKDGGPAVPKAPGRPRGRPRKDAARR